MLKLNTKPVWKLGKKSLQHSASQTRRLQRLALLHCRGYLLFTKGLFALGQQYYNNNSW